MSVVIYEVCSILLFVKLFVVLVKCFFFKVDVICVVLYMNFKKLFFVYILIWCFFFNIYDFN